MQHRSKGVFALTFALFGAVSAASCTNDRLDLFDPTVPGLPPAKDAGPNATPDAAIDAPPPPPDATADTQSTPEPDVAARDAGAPSNEDAGEQRTRASFPRTRGEEARPSMQAVSTRSCSTCASI